MHNNNDKFFWENLYRIGDTGWDIGKLSTPLQSYFDQIKNKDISILIPGAGNAYEAEYLINSGFKKVYVLDIAKEPLVKAKERMPYVSDHYFIEDNFFNHSGQYDLIIEQTFFCALNPDLRISYAKKMTELLKVEGKLVGALFNTFFEKEGPPFGGDIEEYQILFEKYFSIHTLSPCYNSIIPRRDREVFINFEKKTTI